MTDSHFGRDDEKSAESTLFFSWMNLDGKNHLNFRVNYLALLNLHSDIQNTVDAIKTIVSTERKDVLERDTLLLLRARNWRFHLVACGVMLAGLSSSELLDQLWMALKRRSWVSPQIAATGYLIDPRFSERANEIFSQETFDDKSVIAVARLLSQNIKLTEQQEARLNLAKVNDRDNSGKIAVTWAEKARALFLV